MDVECTCDAVFITKPYEKRVTGQRTQHLCDIGGHQTTTTIRRQVNTTIKEDKNPQREQGKGHARSTFALLGPPDDDDEASGLLDSKVVATGAALALRNSVNICDSGT